MTDDQMIVRTFEAAIAEDGAGRTIEGLCVPYNVTARVADDWSPEPYDEVWLPGSFAGATKAPNRVLLDFEHRLSIGDVLGHGVEFEERQDGLVGRFRVDEGAEGDKALRLVRSGVLGGLSVYAKALRSIRSPAGVVQRVRAHLDRVALCRTPAFTQAQVLAVRSAVIEDDLLPVFDPELAARMAKFVPVPDVLMQGTATT